MADEFDTKHKLGLTRSEHLENVNYLANLEAIRVNQFQIIQDFKEKVGSLNTTSERLDFKQFESGFVYIITQITAIETGTGTPQIIIGAKVGGTDHIFESATIGNAEDSVEFVGQIFLKETDRIFVDFQSAVSADTIRVYLNGYKIRR